MNAEEINNQEFCALREETQLTKVNDGVDEFDIFACPIMRFPNAKKAGKFFYSTLDSLTKSICKAADKQKLNKEAYKERAILNENKTNKKISGN